MSDTEAAFISDLAKSIADRMEAVFIAGYSSTKELADWEDAHPDATHAERSAAGKEIRAKYPVLDRTDPERWWR